MKEYEKMFYHIGVYVVSSEHTLFTLFNVIHEETKGRGMEYKKGFSFFFLLVLAGRSDCMYFTLDSLVIVYKQ